MLYQLIAILAALICAAIFFLKRRQNFWKNKTLPSLDAAFWFGNTKNLATKEHWSIVIDRIYKEGVARKFPAFGFNVYFNPTILVVDLDLIRNILIKDFTVFHDRPVYSNPKDDPLTGHLFLIRGEEWRNLRQKLTPTFTSGKMKIMSETMFNVGLELQKFLEDNVPKSGGTDLEIKDILSRFTTDIIGSVAFGIEISSLKDPENEFRRMTKQIFNMPLPTRLRFFLANALQDLSKRLGVRLLPKELSDFFIGVVRKMIDYRETNNVRRNDFLDILLEMRRQSKEHEWTVEELAAQCFVFFVAGFETSSTTMMFVFYELAKHPEIQEKLRKHIKEHVAKANGKVNYETIMEMDYLGQVVDETLRMYPAAVLLTRHADIDYKIPDTDYIIPKKTQLLVPVYSIHHDERNYPDPERFDPERFTKEEVLKRHPCAYLPFGTGPRSCIGNRFGLLQTKVGIYSILSKFEISICQKTEIPPKYIPMPAPLLATKGMWLNMKRLE